MADSERSALDPVNDGKSARLYMDDEEDNEHERQAGGMSRSSSVEEPSQSHEQGSVPASEAARSRSFRALRTAKACDVSNQFL